MSIKRFNAFVYGNLNENKKYELQYYPEVNLPDGEYEGYVQAYYVVFKDYPEFKIKNDIRGIKGTATCNIRVEKGIPYVEVDQYGKEIITPEIKALFNEPEKIQEKIDFEKEYNKWNKQEGKPAYSKPSESSVREFFENNFEDHLTDENIKQLLNTLTNNSVKENLEDIYKVKEELSEKYLLTNENNGVIGISVEDINNEKVIQFNIECDTELQAITEYKGYKLCFNRICEINPVNENNTDKIIVAKIIYSDDISELRPITDLGIKYVLRYGNFLTSYYELDYDYKNNKGEKYIDIYGYAPLGKKLPKYFFDNKNIEYIESIYFKEYVEKNGHEPQLFWTNENISNNELDENVISEQYQKLNEQLFNDYLNSLKDVNLS